MYLGWLLEVSARTLAEAVDSPQEALVQVSRRYWEYVEHVFLLLRLVLPGAATCDAANEAIIRESLCSQTDGCLLIFAPTELQMAAAYTSALGTVFTSATAQRTMWGTFKLSMRPADGDCHTLPGGKHHWRADVTVGPDSTSEWITWGCRAFFSFWNKWFGSHVCR